MSVIVPSELRGVRRQDHGVPRFFLVGLVTG
jgi:hypothetical protein